MMSSLKKIVAVTTALVLVIGPVMQTSMLSASNIDAEAQVCGMSACCCCSTDGAGAVADDVTTRECKCSMSESDEPLEVEMTAIETQPDRVKLFASSPAVIGKALPATDTLSHLPNFMTPDAGQSPPAYIFTCALLI